ncbi:MAG: SDR family NAD(P)-dependent oxidoreductase [Geodermatophilaceae bacterium]|nr:SDR family NAD(P)-dependent oxidoreductase [Geodermatophilaceae bacterium]
MSDNDASVLITGGTGGLGAAVVARFLEAGWRVVVPWVHRSEADRVPQHEALDLIEADLFDAHSVRTVAQRAAAEPARPLRAVANLVGGFAMGAKVHETPVEDFEKQFRLNLRATYLVCQATIPLLVEAGGGAITCVSSRAALRPFAGAAGYTTSKLAVLGFVDALAAEYLDDGVRVNAVLPSVIDTPANRASQPDADHSRWVRPDQIADVLFLLSGRAASVISGAHIPVYGRA